MYTTLLNNLSISCYVEESLTPLNCLKIETNSSVDVVNQHKIIIPYNQEFHNSSELKVTFSNHLCDLLEVIIKGIFCIYTIGVR